MKKSLVLLFVNVLFLNFGFSQNTRLTTENKIGWFNYFGTFKINKKVGIHTEYQFRRAELIEKWQQSLLRIGINYQIDPKVQLRIGYAWIETFPYGEIPINSMGKDFSEHRFFQMITLTDKIMNLDISHRFVLEQRWVGKYSASGLMTEDSYPFLNRFRYLSKIQIPLNWIESKGEKPYIALYDEIFISFGENVGENIFDQNRVGLLFGMRINPTLKLETGYLNQTIQLGREINNRNVFQNNNGVILNVIFNLDLKSSGSKK